VICNEYVSDLLGLNSTDPMHICAQCRKGMRTIAKETAAKYTDSELKVAIMTVNIEGWRYNLISDLTPSYIGHPYYQRWLTKLLKRRCRE